MEGMLFQEDPNRIERLVEKFSNLSVNTTLTNCYRNKLEFGCSYGDEVEQRIREIVDQLIEEKVAWWVDLID